MSRSAIADRVASNFASPFLRRYVRSKLRTDPVYAAVEARLRGHSAPLLDIGCGVGLMELWLRECGYSALITGIDYDAPKIEEARRASRQYAGLVFETGDAREVLKQTGSNILLIDVLHYLDAEQQRVLLEGVAAAVPDGGLVFVRDAIADGTLRYRLTFAAEWCARTVRWLKAGNLTFPRRDAIVAPFEARGYSTEVEPLWGRTPFNNYLFVFRRATSGTTNA